MSTHAWKWHITLGTTQGRRVDVEGESTSVRQLSLEELREGVRKHAVQDKPDLGLDGATILDFRAEQIS